MTANVLVLDASARQALAACRALGAAGYVVGAAGYRETELAAFSRYVSRYHELPDPRGARGAFLPALAGTVERHGYDMVIATDESTIARLRGADVGAPIFPRVDAAWDAITDKVALAGLCAEAGVRYPRTFAPTTPEEDDQAVAAAGPDVVVKPHRSARAEESRVASHVGAVVTDRREVAHASIASIRSAGLQPIVQERVPRADKINLTVFRRDAVYEMRFTYRVLRDVPLTGGIAMTIETVDPDSAPGAEALAACIRVLEAAGFEGVANAEFCISSDGQPVLIEINPRLWGSTWFAERLGQRVSERGVRFTLGLDALPEVPFAIGRRFHHVPGELRWVRCRRDRLRAAVELLRSYGRSDVYEYSDPSDRGVVRRYAALRLRRALRRRPASATAGPR